MGGNNTKTVHGGDLVLDALVSAGVEVVFGVPGGHSTPVYDALSRHPDVRHVLGRSEQGLVYMADGYSRATGKLGVVLTTSGPAVACAAAGLGGVTTDGSSVLVVSSGPRSDLIGHNRGGLHDLNDELEIVRPLCRKTARCATTTDIPGSIADLVATVMNGRGGAAFCEIPADVYATRVSVGTDQLSLPDPAPVSRRPVARETVARAAELLSGAQRPFIIAGYGAVRAGAEAELAEIADLTGAVVTTTALARGILRRDHLGHAFRDGGFWKPLDAVIADADVVLAVGTMFRQEDTADWTMRPGGKLIHIDIDECEVGRSYVADVGIVADAKEALRAILPLLRRTSPAPESWRARGKSAEARYLEARRRQHPPGMEALDVLRAVLPAEAILVADRCSLGYWIWRCYPTDSPRSFQYPMGYGGLGGALPQAIGATIGAPDRPVVCVIGDGGIHFTLGDLAVAAQEEVRFPIILCNNNRYGAISAAMTRSFGHTDVGCELWNPDFSKIAEAYGMVYRRADTLEELGRSLQATLGRFAMIELTVDLADPPPDVDLHW
jgi:thiamine pyrophosphate-dependent acetolactate synthase large subunit-like protein